MGSLLFTYFIPIILFLILYFSSKNNKKNTNAINSNLNERSKSLSVNNEFSNAKEQRIESKNNFSNAQKQKVEPKNNFSIILNIGVFLIILSSIIFATSTWNIYNDYVKVIILGLETLLFLILGVSLKYLFKAVKSGNALTFISSILFFATFLSAGYFKLFGYNFSLHGKYSELFLSSAFLIEAFVLIIRRLLIKSKSYFIPLFCVFASMFFLFKEMSNDFVLSIALISIALIIISLFSKRIFKCTLEFNLFNYILINIFTITYLIAILYQRIFIGFSFSGILPFVVLLISLLINFTINIGRKNETLGIVAIIYEATLVAWFAIFSNNVLTSSIAFIVSGFILYMIYYLSKNNRIYSTSLVTSYLQGIIGIIILCFDKNFTITAPIIAFIYIILTFISSLKKDSILVLNMIFEPMFLILFAIGILVQPNIINSIKPIDAIMVVNLCLIIALVIATLLKNNIRYGYFIVVIIGLFIQILCAAYTSIIYSVITIIINFILLIYTYFSKEMTYKKTCFSLSALFVVTILIGLGKYRLLSALLIFAFLVLFICLTKHKKKKYLYVSLMLIPIYQLMYLLNLQTSIKADLMILLVLPFVLLFSRNIIATKEENYMLIFEFIIFAILFINIKTDIFHLVYVLLLYIFSYVFSFRNEKTSKTYIDYLLFITPIVSFYIDGGNYEALYMICILSLLIINQVLYRILFEKRNVGLEIWHAIAGATLMTILIDALGFSNILSAIICLVLIAILYLVYFNEKMKYVVLSFIVYPLGLLIKYIPYYEVSSILYLFIWIIPVVIFSRKVFNVDKAASDIIESVVLSFMFLPFIFKINMYVGLTLGIISTILILVGILIKHKLLNYVGYASLILTVVIQTANLWGSLPWWFYLSLSGVALVVVAAVIESKKK